MLLPPVVSKTSHGSVREAARLKTRTEVSRRVRPKPKPIPTRRARLPCWVRRILPCTRRPPEGAGASEDNSFPGAIHASARDKIPSVTNSPSLLRGSSPLTGAAASNSAPRRTSNGRTYNDSGRDVGARADVSLSCRTLTELQPVRKTSGRRNNLIAATPIGHSANADGSLVCRFARGTRKASGGRRGRHNRSGRPKIPTSPRPASRQARTTESR